MAYKFDLDDIREDAWDVRDRPKVEAILALAERAEAIMAALKNLSCSESLDALKAEFEKDRDIEKMNAQRQPNSQYFQGTMDGFKRAIHRVEDAQKVRS